MTRKSSELPLSSNHPFYVCKDYVCTSFIPVLNCYFYSCRHVGKMPSKPKPFKKYLSCYFLYAIGIRPQSSRSTTQRYEVFASEGLLDIKDHIAHVLQELPAHLDQDAKIVFNAFLNQEVNTVPMPSSGAVTTAKHCYCCPRS